MDLRRPRALLACALTVLVSACSSGAPPGEVGAGSAPAAPPAAAAAAAAAEPDAAAGAVVAPEAGGAPDPAGAPSFVGLDLDALADAAADAGVAVQVVAFAADGDAGSAPPLVTVQDPPAGTPLPRGRAVVVWLGTPPALPPRTAPAPALPPAAAEEEAVVADAVPATATSAVQPETDAEATGGVAAVDAAPAPAPDHRPSAPTRPRSDIRRMPAAEPGTSFTGRASWYGEELRGSPMACGGPFDPDAATIASRELRCGTRVRITAADGASTEAVVTDWGPAEWTGKRVDLSRAVFEQLAPASRGWLDVEVVVLGE